MPESRNKNAYEEQLYGKVSELIALARKQVTTSVNTTMVHTYFEIGRLIVEDEQQGEVRAAYGKAVLMALSKPLTQKFGKGFSVDNLQNMRQFYLAYSNYETASRNLTKQGNGPIPLATTTKLQSYIFSLSWSHYTRLMRIRNSEERKFYEIECLQGNWSLKELQRQYDSSLYERLALSRDKEQVKLLSEKGQQIQQPSDVLKDPFVLEFLGLQEAAAYSESKLENRIIEQLQHFLLELGKGFAFVGRQVRFTFDEKHFRVDLVFYNRFLRCFVLLDLKIGEVSHQDLGQMQMYVHYYDRFVKTAEENPSIGIILCKEKNNAMVEITLPKENNQIFASKYQTFLPSKEELKALLNDAIEDDYKEQGDSEE